MAAPQTPTEQNTLLDEVVRQSVLSAQHTSRTRLRDAMPDLVMVFREVHDKAMYAGSVADENMVEHRERWLSTIWPKDKTISQLDEDCVDPDHGDVKLFDFEEGNFDRHPTVKNDLVEMFVHQEDVETENGDEYEDEDGNTCADEDDHTSHHMLMVLSPMVAVVLKNNYGNYCDDDFDGSSHGTVYVSENPQQMLSLVRNRLTEFSADALAGRDLEAELERTFGRHYEPPPPASRAPGP